MKNRVRDETRGFTVIEVMLAMSIAVVTLGILLTSFLYVSDASASAATYNLMHANVRHAIDVMERDLHAGVDVLTYASDDDMTFSSLTVSGVVTTRYYVVDKKLHRVVNGDDQILASGIKDLDLILFSDLDKVTTNSAEAYVVEIRLYTEVEVRSRLHTDMLQTAIRLRNK